MDSTNEVVTLDRVPATSDGFGADIVYGLSGRPKTLPSKYFYDQSGSRLFQQITQTGEYYLTRCEHEILSNSCDAIAGAAGRRAFRLVELGAGDGGKTAILIDHFLKLGLDFQYVPIDICRESVDELSDSLARRYDGTGLQIRGLVAEYTDALAWLKRLDRVRNLAIFLGSSIGNFDRRQTGRFVRQLRWSLNPGDLTLMGFDLKKDPEVLRLAYNDAAGLTRRFNLNLLQRLNREFDGDFDLSRFRHHGHYNVRRGRMESWLVSTIDQRVHLRRLKRSFFFRAWEGMHVENSYKYDLTAIERLADRAGFGVERHLMDSKRYFVDSLWRVLA